MLRDTLPLSSFKLLFLKTRFRERWMNGSLWTPNCIQLQEMNNLCCRLIAIFSEASPGLLLKATFAWLWTLTSFLCDHLPAARTAGETEPAENALPRHALSWIASLILSVMRLHKHLNWHKKMGNRNNDRRRTRLPLSAARAASACRKQCSPALVCWCEMTGLTAWVHGEGDF